MDELEDKTTGLVSQTEGNMGLTAIAAAVNSYRRKRLQSCAQLLGELCLIVSVAPFCGGYSAMNLLPLHVQCIWFGASHGVTGLMQNRCLNKSVVCFRTLATSRFLDVFTWDFHFHD